MDIALGREQLTTLGYEAVACLAAKGFCVIDFGFDEVALEQAQEEIRGFEKAGRWRRVNAIIQEGLLGGEGSAFIAELDPPGQQHDAEPDKSMVTTMDRAMTTLGFHMEPYLDSLGIGVSHRSVAVVHQAGEMDEENVPLTETEVAKWLGQFVRHKVMVLIFLGPSVGTLELRPYGYDDVEAEVHELKLPPGTVVVLRPDLMSHRHSARGDSIAMSTFFLGGQPHRNVPSGGLRLIPPAKELDDWTMGRLRELKEQMSDSSIWNPNIPRDWQNAMNHMYHKGQMIAIRGTACKFTSHEDPETFTRMSCGGPDFITEVPMSRWDHTQHYDPELDSWRSYKSYCKHGGFMDGIELFDCKIFNLSPNEAKVMDPHQRLILETGYAALHHMGLRKNTMVNAACGVYVGCGNLEWAMMPKEQDGGAFGATGAALSISSGRFSFTLGLKGPSMTLDAEAATGAVAVYMGAESLQRKGRAAPTDFAVSIGAHLLLAAVWWPTHCASGWLSERGRCLTFDASASGYVRSDGIAAVAMKRMVEVVDGEMVGGGSPTHGPDSNNPPVGMLAGAMMNNNGKGASLAAPYGPAEQEVIADAIRNASVSPLDVDAVEAHGSAALLHDAVEVASLLRAHRSEDYKDLPLVLSATKTMIGNQIEVAGLASLLKAIYCEQAGAATPNMHLRLLNPHSDSLSQPSCLATEGVEFRMQSSFVGVKASGFGGSNAYLLTWGQVGVDRGAQQPTPLAQDRIAFWPGGGGVLERAMQPTESYMIVGSFSEWADPEPMEPEEKEGVYGYTLTLGENRWEQFQIWLDGDSTRVLHPSEPKAMKGAAVLGPSPSAHGCNWLIDGRLGTQQQQPAAFQFPEVLLGPGGPASAALVREVDDSPSPRRRAIAAGPPRPGDLYRVRLRLAGKWRTVDWERLPPGPATFSISPKVKPGRYYVAGSWNDWVLEEMAPDQKEHGVFRLDVVLTRSAGEFQIVRNRDWSQVFYPQKPRALGSVDSPVQGPDDSGHGLNWYLGGVPGDQFDILFSRQVGMDGSDERHISWTKR